MLVSYQQSTRLLLDDPAFANFNDFDLRTYINRARAQVAAQGECTRWLTPTSGPIDSITIVAPGVLYTFPVVVISAPDSPSGQLPNPLGLQATASAGLTAGSVTLITMTESGDGYFNPVVTMTGASGNGAILSANIAASVNRTNVGQEVYRFDDIDLTPDTGARAILSVRSVSVVWGSSPIMLQPMSGTAYMRYARTFSRGYQGTPAVWAQFGQGTNGTISIFPPPNQQYPMIWDCIVLPADLIDDASVELIPDPWREAVPIYAAYLAILGKSFSRPSLVPLADKYYNPKDQGLFGDMMRRARAFAQPSQTRRVN